MSLRKTEESGFISEQQTFEDACRGLCGFALESQQRELNFEYRQDAHTRFLVISRSLSVGSTPGRVADLSNHSSPDGTLDAGADSAEVEDEDDDLAIHHSPAIPLSSSVEYHILYSPTYRVPVLYFSFHDVASIQALGIDAVYNNLVPKHLQGAVKEVGVMGGIGMTNHPLTGIPCFWVHPCNTAEAMSSIMKGIDREISALEYLMIWVGVVGAAVGLSLPRAIMLAKTDSNYRDT